MPMCGVPHHAARGYVAQAHRARPQGRDLRADRGRDPREARWGAKGLVKREVVRVVTPGIVLDDEVLDPKRPRYVVALVPAGQDARSAVGIAYLDATTGELARHRARGERGDRRAGADRPARGGRRARAARRGRSRSQGGTAPRLAAGAVPRRRGTRRRSPTRRRPGRSSGRWSSSIPPVALAHRELAIRAAAAVVAYARATQPTGALPIARLQLYEPGDCGRARRSGDREPRARRDPDRQAARRARCST